LVNQVVQSGGKVTGLKELANLGHEAAGLGWRGLSGLGGLLPRIGQHFAYPVPVLVACDGNQSKKGQQGWRGS
jgi:hypothetical protein